jgi:hypothetical protein
LADFVTHYAALRLPAIQAALTHRTSTLQFNANVRRATMMAAGGDKGMGASATDASDIDSAGANTAAEGEQLLARIRAITAEHASRWLSIAPTERDLELTDAQYHWAARLRLGLPVPPSSSTCASCGQHDAFASDSWHHLSCQYHRGREVTNRHHAVVDCIAKHVRMCGVRYKVEPTHLSERDDTRPDLQIFSHGGTQLIDVSISHPMAPSHRGVAKTAALAVASRSAARKCAKYKSMAKQQDAQFSAFACETLGGLHKSAIEVIRHVASLAEEQASLYSEHMIRRSLLDSVAMHIQRGNARVMMSASMIAREASSASLIAGA